MPPLKADADASCANWVKPSLRLKTILGATGMPLRSSSSWTSANACSATQANELIHQIGTEIVQDRKYSGVDWSAISVVSIINDAVTDMTGFTYDQTGKARPGTPSNLDLMDRFEALRAEGQGPWQACLFQIRRADMKVTVDFEYENPGRWKVTPANLDAKAQEIRPD